MVMLARRLERHAARGHSSEAILETSDVTVNGTAQFFARLHSLEIDLYGRLHGSLQLAYRCVFSNSSQERPNWERPSSR